MKKSLSTFLRLSFFLALSLCSLSCTSHRQVKPPLETEHAPKLWLRPGILNSTRIEEKFGSFGLSLLFTDDKEGLRLSNLYSEHEGQKITRTIALVSFVKQIDSSLEQAHQEILDGASIGSTFSKYGFSVKKNILYKGESANMPASLNKMMHIQKGEFATLIYDLSLIKNDNSFAYCTITEIYSPDFLTMAELNELYPSLQFNGNHTEIALEPSVLAKVNENIEFIKAKLAKIKEPVHNP